MVFKFAAPIALVAASKAFLASTVCAEAVPANRMISTTRMHVFRVIRFPHSQKFSLNINNLDFWDEIQDGHPYTPAGLSAEPKCVSSDNFKGERGWGNKQLAWEIF